MTMKLLFKTDNGTLFEGFVHGEHECDMYDFLKNHEKHILHHTPPYIRTNIVVEWGWIELTAEDIEKIKKTAWYSNHTQKDTSVVDNFLKEGFILEILTEEYIFDGE